ncbi:MAG: hypothetical protein Q9222_004095 [Ikaeria aurantiellina]
MASEAYQNFGRGGAGNYYSKQDIQEIQKQAANDIEAQPTTAGELRAADTKAPEYIHSGRGGAGNYSNASDTVERQKSVDMMPNSREGTVPEGGFYGRGGAGNMRSSTESSAEEIERRASETQKKAYEEAVQDVEKGLQPPEKAHLARE